MLKGNTITLEMQSAEVPDSTSEMNMFRRHFFIAHNFLETGASLGSLATYTLILNLREKAAETEQPWFVFSANEMGIHLSDRESDRVLQQSASGKAITPLHHNVK